MTETDTIKKRGTVLDAIAKAAIEAGRDPGAITLTAVSKTHGAEAIEPLLETGQRDFGENRVQEAQGKWPALKERYPDIRLRLIGPLQSNKAEAAVALFDVIESVDREKIARVLGEVMRKQGRPLPVYVQVNTGEEPQKAGIPPTEAVAFAGHCREAHGLDVVGLMCIPPADQPPAPHFALLHKLVGEAGLAELSMGMSGDYEAAVSLGATSVRVGSALFGARPAP